MTTKDRSVERSLLIIFLLAVSAFGFQPVKDTDFGWHYRCGKDLLAGEPCTRNDYSYYLPNYHAYNPSFVYDGLISVIYDQGGFLGLSILNALIITVTGLIIYRLVSGSTPRRLLFTALVLLTPGPSLILGLRSQVVTFCLFCVILLLLRKAERYFRYLWLLPLIFLLWVNTHIGFISGLLLLPGYIFSVFWQDLTFESNFPSKKLRIAIVVCLLCFGTTLLNPFGYKVYVEILRHALSPLGTTIAEWVAPPVGVKVLVIITAFLVGSAGIAFKKLPLGALITLLIFTALTYTGIRNLPFFTLLLLYYLSMFSLPKQFNKLSIPPGRYKTFILSSVGLFFALLFLVRNYPNFKTTYTYDTVWESYCYKGQVSYPCEFIKKYPNLTGNLYAMYEWGGFLIWQLPKAKVFADGRTPAWLDENGYSTYQVLLAILQNQPGWNEKLSETKTDYILVSPGTFMDLLLKEKAADYGWREEFRDGASVFYVRLKQS